MKTADINIDYNKDVESVGAVSFGSDVGAIHADVTDRTAGDAIEEMQENN